jgi:hypothetical protein
MISGNSRTRLHASVLYLGSALFMTSGAVTIADHVIRTHPANSREGCGCANVNWNDDGGGAPPCNEGVSCQVEGWPPCHEFPCTITTKDTTVCSC